MAWRFYLHQNSALEVRIEELKILFALSATEGWIGGVNYYKNLFLALKRVHKPMIVPVAAIDGDSENILAPYYEQAKYKVRRDWKFYIKKLLNTVFDKNYDCTGNVTRIYKDYDLLFGCTSGSRKADIIWIPDFQHLHLPQMFSDEEIQNRNIHYKEDASDAKIVILSSNDALKDFTNFCPEYISKARVLHFVSYIEPELYSETDSIIKTVINKYKLPERFFFIPNQFWRHKNHIVVFKALKILRDAGYTNIHVVCSGNTEDYRNRGYFQFLLNYIDANDLKSQVHILGVIPYIEVIALIRYSVALLQPSLFEGWSSCIEEAKSIGKNCILSNLSVHVEQNPPNSVFFNPYDDGELANILLKTYNAQKGIPCSDLEKKAREGMELRMMEFGETFKKIALEAMGR